MSITIKDFHIGQYRGINNLSLRDLNHINVLTGKNDTGKTSILELIDTLSSLLSPAIWQHESFGSHFSGISFFTELLRLFPYYLDVKEIFYDYTDTKDKFHKVRLHANVSKSLISERELSRLNGYADDNIKDRSTEDKAFPVNLLEVHASFDGNDNDFAVYDRQRTTRWLDDIQFNIPTMYISPGAAERANYNNSFLKRIVGNSDQYRLMLLLLKELDENITGFNLINDECVIQINHSTDYIPLSLFGNGVKKAVNIVMSALAVPKGILLIDEFETSIHPSALKQTLVWLITTAIENDTQVFLSTHSTETLSAICDLKEEDRRKINIYTLYHNEKISVRRMNAVKAAEVSKMGVSLL